jgi:predicted RNA-binding protein with PUA domain
MMLPSAVRIFVATQPTDLRQAFDTLAETTRRVLQQEIGRAHV